MPICDSGRALIWRHYRLARTHLARRQRAAGRSRGIGGIGYWGNRVFGGIGGLTLNDRDWDDAAKELVRGAQKRGYVTQDQINALLPSEEVNSEQIEDILVIFSEMGINVVEMKETGTNDE